METNEQKKINEFTIQYDQSYNPTIHSKNSLYPLQFYQTKESMMDVEHYKRFLENAISRFRKSRTYKHYKGYLIGLGLDHCQLLPGVRADMEDDENSKKKQNFIEMHHNFLTIFDIALMITEHVLNTKGFISTFDLVQLLKEEHKNNRIPLVMLCKTAHQLHHNNQEFMIPANMCFGFWQELLQKYQKGITENIANKVLLYIQKSLEIQEVGVDFTNNLLKLREDVLGWSEWNECGDTLRISSITY
ncbi:MAG: hypothetical protein PHC62_00915 [Candidatus Izemoplasmatales bacterium]|nr:hypothetical protein [Candidatus Izemoplasmatales bacterium]